MFQVMQMHLPVLGLRYVVRSPENARHYLWLSRLGWHDCGLNEDAIIQKAVNA